MTRFMIVEHGGDTWPERWDQDPKLGGLKRMHSVGLTQLGLRENVPETFSRRSLASSWCLNLRIKYLEHDYAVVEIDEPEENCPKQVHPEQTTKTLYSQDGLNFTFNSVEELVESYMNTGKNPTDATYYSAEHVQLSTRDIVSVNHILTGLDAALSLLMLSTDTPFNNLSPELREDLFYAVSHVVTKSGILSNYWRRSEPAVPHRAVSGDIPGHELADDQLTYSKIRASAVDKINDLRALNAKYETALRKLSCLGNGEKPGNATGNLIAREALGW